MNEKDKAFLKLLEDVLAPTRPRYKEIPSALLEFIETKYLGNGKCLCSLCKDRLLECDSNKNIAIFLVYVSKLKKEGTAKAKSYNMNGGYSTEEVTLDDYENRTIIGLGKYGHELYDLLKKQELEELSLEILSKQAEILKKQGENSQDQTKILRSTLLIYILMAAAMLIQTVVDYIINSKEVDNFMKFGLALLIITLSLIYTLVGKNLDIKLENFSKIDRLLTAVIVVAFLVFFIIVVTSPTTYNQDKSCEVSCDKHNVEPKITSDIGIKSRNLNLYNQSKILLIEPFSNISN